MVAFLRFAGVLMRVVATGLASLVVLCAAAQSASAYQINVRTILGGTFPLEVNGTDTIAVVKAKIEAAQGTPVALQRLIYTPGILDDAVTLATYGIGPGVTIFVLISRPPPPPPVPRQNTDSQDVRSLQLAATRAIALGAGQAISGAVTRAIEDSCASGAGWVCEVPSAGTLQKASGLGGPDARLRSHLGFGSDAAAAGLFPPGLWHTWGSVNGLDIETASDANESTDSRLVTVTTGLGYRLSRSVVIGAVAGYEDFKSTASTLDGTLSGNGWTAGGYAAWSFLPGLRAEAAGAYSNLNYDAAVRTAEGSFDGHRWLASGGLTGTVALSPSLALQPSARVLAVWEDQDAWTDSRGTAQAARGFSAGRSSFGAKLSQTWPVTAELALTPYAGVYADYYFGSDDHLPVSIEGLGVSDGWSARGLIGLAAELSTGARLSVEGEYGSLGSAGSAVSWTARGALPF